MHNARSRTEQETMSNAMEIKARSGYIIGINHNDNEMFDYFIKVPDVEDLKAHAASMRLQYVHEDIPLIIDLEIPAIELEN
jgi:hypothetical protein